jgi:hypothetical protein
MKTLKGNQEQQVKIKKLPPIWKTVIYVLTALPSILLFLYVTGAWTLEIVDGALMKGDREDIIQAFCIFAGPGAFFIQWAAFKFLEER